MGRVLLLWIFISSLLLRFFFGLAIGGVNGICSWCDNYSIFICCTFVSNSVTFLKNILYHAWMCILIRSLSVDLMILFASSGTILDLLVRYIAFQSEVVRFCQNSQELFSSRESCIKLRTSSILYFVLCCFKVSINAIIGVCICFYLYL